MDLLVLQGHRRISASKHPDNYQLRFHLSWKGAFMNICLLVTKERVRGSVQTGARAFYAISSL
jgi:hypothetical protein